MKILCPTANARNLSLLLAALILAVPMFMALAGDEAELRSKLPMEDGELGCRGLVTHLEREGEGGPGQVEWLARYYEINGEMEFHVDPDSSGIDGRVRAYLTPIEATNVLVLDALPNLIVSAVTVDGVAATWTDTHDDKTITIETPGILLNVEHVVEITYRAGPDHSGFGAFFFPHYRDGDLYYQTAQTMVETQYAGSWWPCIDRLTHKADSVAINITVPDTMIVASNGTLELPIDTSVPGKRTYRWKERYPIHTYLVSMTIANFADAADTPASPGPGLPWTERYQRDADLDHDLDAIDMDLTYFVWKPHLETAQINLASIPTMMDCFREKYGEYPFKNEKYGIAEFSFNGGMEHQTLSSIGFGSLLSSDTDHYVQSHELAHMWYGDQVGPASWENIWLNEGFATYSEALYYEYIGRYVHAGEYMYTRRRPSNDRLFQGSVYDPDVTFGATTYHKGGWVLHMLRQLTGDPLFFDIMRSWAQESVGSGGVATTEQLVEHVRARANAAGKSHLDIEDFFDRWVYGTGRPAYYYEWASSGSGTDWQVDMDISQTQSGDLFPDSLDVMIHFAFGDSTTLRIAPGEQKQTYEWDFSDEPVEILLDPDWRLLHNAVAGLSGNTPISLRSSYPNPFNASNSGTTIQLAVRQAGFVEASIYDISGRHVRELVSASQTAGIKTYTWHGRDDDGQIQAYGIYFIRAESAGHVETKKVMFFPDTSN